MSSLTVLARALTVARFVAILPFVALLNEAAASGAGSPALAALWVAVAISDWSDGRIARRANAATPLWGRLDAAADISFNASTLAAAAWLEWISPWAPLAVVVMGLGFLARRSPPHPEASLPTSPQGGEVGDRPGKLAGVLFYALVGMVAAEGAAPGILGAAFVRFAGDVVAVYAAGVVSARFAMSSWRRWTKRSA
jgi:phosphatidylglycerophosphate synthase